MPLPTDVERLWMQMDKGGLNYELTLVLADAIDESGAGDEAEGLRVMVQNGQFPDPFWREAIRLKEYPDAHHTLPETRLYFEWLSPNQRTFSQNNPHRLDPSLFAKMLEQVQDDPDYAGVCRESLWLCFMTRSGALKAYMRAYAAVKQQERRKKNEEGIERAGVG